MTRAAPLRHDPIDEDFWSTNRLFIQVSRPGEAADADHLLLLHCGYPMVQMNVAHVKDFDADPREIGERACAWFHERKLPFMPMVRTDRAARFAPALRDAGWRAQPGMPALRPPAEARPVVADLEIRRVRDDRDLAAFRRTAFVEFGLPEPAGRLYLTEALRDTPAVTLRLGSLYERMGFAWSHDYARWTPPGQPV